MRTLAADLAERRGVTSAWRRLLDEAPFAGRLVDAYAFGEPYLSLNALVLTPDEATELARLSTVFAGIFAKAATVIAEDAGLTQGMGFPWPAVELLQEETVLPVLLGRFDFGLDEAGRWQLFEFNSDTPSGIREAIAAERLMRRAFGRGPRRLSSGLGRRLAMAAERRLQDCERAVGRPVQTVGIVTQASYQEDMGQSAFLADLLNDFWARQGRERRAVVGDIGNLWAEDDDLWLFGRRVDALYRLYPYERLYGGPLFAPLCEAVADGRVCLLNGLRGFLPQSKAVMAWIWAQRAADCFTAEEQEAIAGHLPPTYRLDDAPQDVARAAWVVKEFWGREGEEVYLGSAITDEDWDRCVSWGTFVAQQRVTTQEVTGLRLDGGRAVTVPAWASVGAFVVDGRFAGCYSRIGGAITNARAKFLATLVEGGRAPSFGPGAGQ